LFPFSAPCERQLVRIATFSVVRLMTRLILLTRYQELLNIYPHLDRDQVGTPELCSNRFWAKQRSWRSGRSSWEVARPNSDYATTCKTYASNCVVCVGDPADICNERLELRRVLNIYISVYTAIRLTWWVDNLSCTVSKWKIVCCTTDVHLCAFYVEQEHCLVTLCK
jgi:hypothetical protein